MPASDVEIREMVADFLDGRSSVLELEEWLVVQSWDAPPRSLAARLQLRLAEYLSGHWSESQLKELIAPLVHAYTYERPPAHVRSSSASEVQTRTLSLGVSSPVLTFRFESADTGSQVARA